MIIKTQSAAQSMVGILASILLGFFALSFTVRAASAPQTGYISGVVTSVSGIVNTVIPLLIAIALLLFIWGLVVYIFNSGDDAAKEEGKRKMIWGVLALFVIVSVWGLVALLNEITGVDQGSQVVLPTGPTGAGGGGGGGGGPPVGPPTSP